ncbi:hypothetical protein K501DRAFT_216369 [Backusella circina FSU 941]|nr:hypothetical protein K501DRAFT_216369 [Backusella circina FSU 941]
MLKVGYLTPFRILLLLLIRKFCTYDCPTDLISQLVVFIIKNILNGEKIKSTCSELSFQDFLHSIQNFNSDKSLIQSFQNVVLDDIKGINTPHHLVEFMTSLPELMQEPELNGGDRVVLDKASVFGMFVRACIVEYDVLASDYLSDIYHAYQAYISRPEDDIEQDGAGDKIIWMSDYNINAFLREQSENLERAGSCKITPSQLHGFLTRIERYAHADSSSISQLRQVVVLYLNYMRTNEYLQSALDLHLFSDSSLNNNTEIHHTLLNLAIMEYKFGHYYKALSMLKDALTSARENKDERCLQEIQFWTEKCGKKQSSDEKDSYVDDYLNNMKLLTHTCDLIHEGGSSNEVFESLYRSLANINIKRIENMTHVHYLIHSLAWRRYGNNIMAKHYLELATSCCNGNVSDIEKMIVLASDLYFTEGDSKRALEILDTFSKNYPDESETLLGWRQAKTNILGQIENRKWLSESSEIMLTSTDTKDYIDTMHEIAVPRLIENLDFKTALVLLEEIHGFAIKSNQNSKLGCNLMLQGEAHLRMNYLQSAKEILTEAMKTSRAASDAKVYYGACILLSEAFIRSEDSELLKKAIFILEQIFPKVLVLKSKQIQSDLYFTYAEALRMKMTSTSDELEEVLSYITDAEEGYKELCYEMKLVRVLHSKAIVLSQLDRMEECEATVGYIKGILYRQ